MRRRRVSGSANTARPYVDNVVAHRPYVHPSCFLTLAILNGPNFRTDSLGEVHFPAVTSRARRCTVWGMAAFVVARPSLCLMCFLSCMHCAPVTARIRNSGAYRRLTKDPECASDTLTDSLPEDARTTSSTDRLVASGAASESITRRRETQHSKWYIVPRIDLGSDEY